jgi:LuxR family maltose regulon positive regulatory protein
MPDAFPSEQTSRGSPSSAVLATKLYAPRVRPDFVARPRLADRLDGGGGLLTLVSAPAGFGKTSLLADWIARSSRPVAWVSLDEDENGPARLLAYLAAALERVDARLGAQLGPLLGSPTPLKPAFTAVINAAAEWGEDLTLVLDDYQTITSEAIHQAVAYFAERLPPNLVFVIATRTDPPFPLARWRARGWLREFRIADLRFEDDEAAAFLNGIVGLGLAPADLAALEERTEGWIAGLQLAALSLKGREDASEFVRAFAGDDRYVLDYLVDEVLDRQPAPVQEFLLRTSVLRRLCGPLCDEVTGGAEGRSTLERLERGNLFLVPLDAKREWYRYHHLFADLLPARERVVRAPRLRGRGCSPRPPRPGLGPRGHTH